MGTISIIGLVVILLIVICATFVTFQEYKLLKKSERENLKHAEEIDSNYKMFLKEIKEECVEALQINDYRNCKEHYKTIITYIDKIL